MGAIKRALHDLTRVASSLPQRDNISLLREAHDLLRQIARRNGVDPDNAVQLGRAAARSQRDRVDLASSSAQD